jgi:hypothetical protein
MSSMNMTINIDMVAHRDWKVGPQIAVDRLGAGEAAARDEPGRPTTVRLVL